MEHPHENHETPPSFWRSRFAIGYLVIGAVAAYYLLTEHLAHVVGVLPYLILLACPLMHIFMHGGHGHGSHGHQHSQNKNDKNGSPS
ncbi:MAG: DUF2933 domain-containing protein [Methyloversatilis sp.]|jgi:hypothetical protein|uniref:DUF2933 domain-containing protein n=1 Tax=Methyloversatilis sp. TaxID=2569862 RepID=UPI0027354D16|nr:DUF2933 domain-containing protein [Methyloversatilis sp.]MDP2868662.1 DUF2933 domain-containing protein [Methyloversatilis sp.]